MCPTYDYFCKSCDKTWEDFKSIAERKEPESKPCPKCGADGTVEQTIVYTALPMADNVRLGRVKPPTQLREKFQQIHEKTPGSRLDKVSNLTKI